MLLCDLVLGDVRLRVPSATHVSVRQMPLSRPRHSRALQTSVLAG